MIDTIAKPEVEIDPALISEVNEATSVVTDNYTLADALREGSTMVKQVHGTWGTTEGEGCALTAIATAVTSHNIEF